MPHEQAMEKGRVLIPIARAAISRALGMPREADESASWLGEPGASFVTLTKGGDLRGCIGSLEAHRSLLEDVKANAVAAALRDPRFPPVSVPELESLEVEVSLLSGLEPLSFASEAEVLAQLRPGVDGVVLAQGGRRGTFLPQVWESLPRCEDFLAHLKMKAGFRPDWWSSDARLYRYTVEKWKETDLLKMGAI
jgi:AmmeMemoRadiSam system protein A